MTHSQKPDEFLESAMLDLVVDGLMERKIVIDPDATTTTESHYRLTPKGIDEARALILRLATTKATDTELKGASNDPPTGVD